MEIVNRRTTFTHNSTIGELSIDGTFQCYILEPTDRGLTGDMSLDQIATIKIPGHTAIPTGVYNLIFAEAPDLLPRFPRLIAAANGAPFMFPELQDVKGFTGIFIHPGNYPGNTEGCNLPGISQGTDFVGSSTVAFVALKAAISAAIVAGQATYEITREVTGWDAFNSGN